jgi:hypothetical protein
MKTEIAGCSKISATVYKTTRHQISRESDFYSRRRGNIKSHQILYGSFNYVVSNLDRVVSN